MLMFANGVTHAQNKGIVQTDTLISVTLSHNVTHENVKRAVTIYLPPGYATSAKRYPVLYLLHGIGDDNMDFAENEGQFTTIQDLMDTGIAAQRFREMIIVTPDEKTNWFGSFYTNSSATGNWDDFTAIELVHYIDNRYRTIARAASRAIAGHSMGGYGAISLAMKHPDIFSIAYGMNSALISPGGEINPGDSQVKEFVLAKTAQDYKDLFAKKQYVAVGLLTVAQAFSPNLSSPPLYIDKPFRMDRNKVVINPLPYEKWLEHDVVRMADKYKANLLKLRGLKFDSGYEDEYKFIPINSRAFSKKLTELGIPHSFEEYNGDHRNRLWGLNGRIYLELLPFISDHMEGQ